MLFWSLIVSSSFSFTAVVSMAQQHKNQHLQSGRGSNLWKAKPSIFECLVYRSSKNKPDTAGTRAEKNRGTNINHGIFYYT
ncbi:hypothetical protein V8C26DRAFT_410830 [Trichoderma gracile]